ncbi:hypothetical protein HPB52_014943 [Rhipicephalus sanguineus]|uniref:THAP-type domain-containing protein n=1 Tax=Rhipicephalus sanguineus TaxID=34632 RepID=A0A9D4QAA8_RHISA|nr:hypothetical protein HPB52_014943 [Rhipicephalus sanguineus]
MAPKFYCVLRNCATKEGDKVVFHHFPSNDGQRQLWTEFVQAVEGSSWRPDKRSQVCSQHFSSDCYMYNMQYCEDFGLKTRRNYLKKGSVPTLYPPGLPHRNFSIMVNAATAMVALPVGQCSATAQCSPPVAVKSTQDVLSKRSRAIGVQVEVKTEAEGTLE